MSDVQEMSCLIIDWGTTNFRAFAMNAKGDVLDKKELKMGLLQVENGAFAASLEKVLSGWLPEYKALPIYMAGMVGSQQGWVNVDYASTAIGLLGVAEKAHRFELPWGAPAVIIPGVSHESSVGVYDVMRGEEVQLFGLAKLAGVSDLNAVMPGTHSKHASFNANKLTKFASFMTGELFSVISEHTILGRGLPEQVSAESSDAFLKGVAESKTAPLTSIIFKARTHRLFKTIADSEVLDYLSGVLIGYELKDLSGDHVYLVGGRGLCARYKQACDVLSVSSTYMNGDDCFLAGMADLIKVLSNDN